MVLLDFKFTLTCSFSLRKEQLMKPSPLSGLRVAVTGGTSGLGLALVEALHREGASVAFVARRADRVAAVAARHPGTHGFPATSP
jgi:NADPH:quinone reductase-like Zn-dependent oxidoreductase